MMALIVVFGFLCCCVGSRVAMRTYWRAQRRKKRAQAYRIAVPGILDDDGSEDVLPPGIACAVRASSAAASANYADMVPARYLVDPKKLGHLTTTSGPPGVRGRHNHPHKAAHMAAGRARIQHASAPGGGPPGMRPQGSPQRVRRPRSPWGEGKFASPSSPTKSMPGRRRFA